MPSPVRPQVGLPRPVHVRASTLAALAAPAGASIDAPDVDAARAVTVTGVTASSSHVRQGDLFAALPGRTTHGARFAAEAIAAGAVAVLTDPAGRAEVPSGVPALLVADVRRVLGPLASAVYGDPSRQLRVLGVTGTSGKTTTTYFLRAGLAAAGGHTPGLIGTIGTVVADEEVKTGFTTPEAPDVHALLAVMRERGVTDVAMEVSSHALELGRVGGVDFDVAGFTNLSQDHLDFHPDMEAYYAAKRRLFDGAAWPVVVVDDAWGQRLAREVGDCTSVGTRPGVPADWQARDVRELPGGRTVFTAVHGDENVQAGTVIPGRFNVANALLAVAMLHRLGVAVDVAADAVAAAVVPGRMERVDAGQDFLALVDYSHKPAAVSGALEAVRRLTPGRLIVVLGCGGDRDRGKRPAMGDIAARGADLLVVTDDNPRSEDPAAIRRAMLDGALAVPPGERGDVVEIGDREEAINAAVRAAGHGDTVLVAGKGHETGQEIAGVVHPFDDRDVLRSALTGVAR